MTIQKDFDILAADLLALENRALNVLGTGSNTYGYGQIFNPVGRQGQDIEVSHLNLLRDMLNNARMHQLGNDTGFGASLPVPVRLTDITASLVSAYQAAITTIENNRMTYGAASMSVTGRLASLTRSQRWGPAQTIVGGMDVRWPTDDEARWFFNSGGEIRLNFGHPSTGTRQDRAWNRTLSRIGTIRFRAQSTIADANQVGAPVASAGYYTISGQTAIYNGAAIDDTFDYLDARYTPPNKYQFKDSVYVYAARITGGLRFLVEMRETNNEINSLGTFAGFSAMYATRYLRNRLIRLPGFYLYQPL